MEGKEMEEIKDMTPKLIGETWRKYPTDTSKQKATYGLFECQYCKTKFETNMASVKRGDTKSCGCQRKGINVIHGLSHNIFYMKWKSILARCNNPQNASYINYGGRGIKVCNEWLSLQNFIIWCEETYIEGMTLDRIDNDKGYSPDNCRWVDRVTQTINRRTMKSNKSGYVGVSWRKDRNKWTVRIGTGIKYECLGHFDDLMEAVIFRDNYIIENKLPHKLNLKQEETK